MVVDFADDGGSAVLSWTDRERARADDAVWGQHGGRAAGGPAGHVVGHSTPWRRGRAAVGGRRGDPLRRTRASRSAARGPPEPVRDLVVAPDGTWAVTGATAPAVLIWDIDPATARWSHARP